MQKQTLQKKKKRADYHLQAQAPKQKAPAQRRKPRLIEAQAPIDDGALISEQELLAEKRKLQQLMLVPQEITLPPMHMPTVAAKKARRTRLEAIRAAIAAWILSVFEWLSPRQKKKLLTMKGERALEQLRELAAIYQISSSIDGMDIVQFEALFGEAYYQIMQESKRHKSSRSREIDEDYAKYMEHFARHASGIS